ncbi:MAG TPA: NnrU family protein [Paracoccaceae bacterium]|nr:NnrU family protein [Paracoccaceae bacterium]
MPLLILGLALWWVGHLFPIVARPRRDAIVARIGEGPWKGIYSLVSVATIALMVIGYQRAGFTNVWYPPAWGVHLNNLLMILAVGLFAASHSKGNAKRFVRHPMLLSVVVWAISHLLVNGDLASLVLFGGTGAWAAVAIFATNARDGAWVKPEPKPVKKDLLLVAITLVAYAVFGGIHAWLGVWPFPG